ncbi:invasion associated locus B family protein [Cognatishimia activa]|uniref:invasion associated locus B family protein n=1 Tax=Cognatishimia activa TaxID=1715691 RepID=UPI002230EF5D|nr:invasion associated locus B family protein [Cognatishimia activa]UZD92633.1 invasion associated locus B family protein [Cognatishimia activa]
MGTVLGALTMIGSTAMAQESSNQVAAKTDWSVFVESSPKECWAVTTFKESVNTRNGAVVAVNRSQTLLMVFFRPDAGVKGQVGFTGGYPFKSGSTVSMKVDDNTYDLFTEGEWAWPQSADDDAKIVAAMKRGKQAILSGESGRGTRTKDTFSLLGFTAAHDDAGKRCG